MSEKIAAVYTDTLHENLFQYAAWPIGTPIALGDYGTLNGRLFVRQGNIVGRFGIAVNGAKATTSLMFEFKSSGISTTQVAVDASTVAAVGGVPAKVKAKTTLSFANGDSVYFRSIKVVPHTIDNLGDVSKGVMQKFQAGDWNGTFVFVNSLFVAGGTTVLVSSFDKAAIEIESSAGISQMDLADASLNLAVTSESNVGLTVLAKEKLVPLFGLSQVRPRLRWLPFFSGKTVKTLLATDFAQTQSPDLPASNIAQLNPEISPNLASDLGKDIDECFHVVEIP
jgi:hypothetical protein